MSAEKITELNKIRDEVYALYPNATKISITFEGDKILVSPNEKYDVPSFNSSDGE
jgi:hypothetical protein